MSVYRENVPPPSSVSAAQPQAGSGADDELVRSRCVALQEEEKANRLRERVRKAREEAERREKAAWSADFVAAIAGSKAVRLVTMVVGLLVGTCLVSNLLDLLRLVESPNPVVRAVAVALSSALAFGIAVCIWYAHCTFGKLPSFKPVTLVRGQEPTEAAKRLAEGYMSKFPAEASELVKLDRGEVAISGLILELKGMDPEDDGAGWLGKFEELQRRQGKIAELIIADSWKSVAIKTAACPWKSADMLIVFVNTTMMVASIAQVYHRRLTRMAAFRYVVRWFGFLYVSGRLQDMSESCADMAGNMVEPLGGVFTTVPLLKQLVGKTAEGVANAYMTYRLGNCAVKEFKALKVI